jgi:multicomponent K+:H+ antiporter subunit E
MTPRRFATWLPAPWLSLALAALWLVLNNSWGAGQFLMAAALGVGAPLLARPLRPTPVRLHRPLLAIVLFLRVGGDVIVSNWRVLRATLAREAPPGGFVTVPLDLRDPNGLAVLAAIMCVIPGTIWSEMALDRSALIVHIFDLQDAQAEIALIKSRYERPLMDIFEGPQPPETPREE